MEPEQDEASSALTPPGRLRELAQREPLARLVAKNTAAPADVLRELARREPLAASVAANPAAPADVLELLSSSWRPDVRALVAANPAVSTPVLWKLAVGNPEAVLSNPLFGLAVVETPDLGQIPWTALCALLGTGKMPPDWFRWTARHYLHCGYQGVQVLRRIASMPAPPDVLLSLCDAGVEVARLLKNPALPPEGVVRIASCGNVAALGAFAASAHAAPAWLSVMANVQEPQVREAVARNPATPMPALLNLCRDPSPNVRRTALSNPSAPLSLAVQGLRADVSRHNRHGRACCASNGNFLALALSSARQGRKGRASEPGSLRHALGSAVKPQMLRRAAEHPQASPGSLDVMARSPCLAVRVAVAANPRAAPATLARLAHDRRHEVRRAVARHPSTPDEVRQALAADPVASVRKATARKRR